PLAPAALELADARASGKLRLELHPARAELAVDGDVSLADARVRDARLAEEPVPIAGHARVRGRITGGADEPRQVAVDELRVTVGGLAVEMTATARLVPGAPAWPPDSGALTVTVPRVACATALAAL